MNKSNNYKNIKYKIINSTINRNSIFINNVFNKTSNILIYIYIRY